MENNAEKSANGSYLTNGVLILGSVETKKDLLLEGRIVGNVRCEALLTVKKGAVVEGDVLCNNLTLEGGITGNVHVSAKAHLHSFSVIKGYLQANQLIIHPEATVEKGLHIK